MAGAEGGADKRRLVRRGPRPQRAGARHAGHVLLRDRRHQAVGPRAGQVKVDTSAHHVESRLWLEATLRKSAVPLTDPTLTVATQGLAKALPYQVEACRQALDPANLRPRILLADAVGLGKTIEIGMILAELTRRGRGERILVVTPRHVLEQMQFEMWTRFALLRLGFRRVLAVDRRAEMKAAELRRRCGVQTAAQMRGIVVEFDYDDLAAVAGDAGARITSVFVCVNDDAMNVALGHEAAQSFPGVTVSVRMSSLTSGIGLLMTKQPDTPRIRFVGFHDEAKNVDVLRDAEGRLSQDDSA